MIGVENFTQKDPLKHSSKHLSFILRAPDPNGFPIFIFSVEASKKHLSGANNERKRLQEEMLHTGFTSPVVMLQKSMPRQARVEYEGGDLPCDGAGRPLGKILTQRMLDDEDLRKLWEKLEMQQISP